MAVAIRSYAYGLALPARPVLRARAVVGVSVLACGLLLSAAAEALCAASTGWTAWAPAVVAIAVAAVTIGVLGARLRAALRGSVPIVSVWPRRSLAAGLGLSGLTALSVALGAPGRGMPAAVATAGLVLAGSAVALRLVRPVARVLVVGDPVFHERMLAAARGRGRFVVARADASQGGAPSLREAFGRVGAVDELAVQPDAFGAVQQAGRPDGPRRARVIVPLAPAPDEGVHAHRAWRAPFAHPWGRAERLVKRVLDLLIAPPLLLLCMPLLTACALAIVLDSRGGPLLRQRRVGVDGREFTIYKLRTMRRRNSDAEHRRYYASLIRGEAAGHDGVHKLVNDRRVTRVGHVLRRYSIDEIPQLWNVIRGDMSTIGPRPPLPHEVELYDARAWQRLRVKPGISGLWQVSGRCELDFRQMVDLDVRYWQRWSVRMELRILLLTPWTVVAGRGAA